jgi:hypothetical protein
MFIFFTEALFSLQMARAEGDSGQLWQSKGTMQGGGYGLMDLGINQFCRAANWINQPEVTFSDNTQCHPIVADIAARHWEYSCGGEGSATVDMPSPDKIQALVSIVKQEGQFLLNLEMVKIGECDINSDQDEEDDEDLLFD